MTYTQIRSHFRETGWTLTPAEMRHILTSAKSSPSGHYYISSHWIVTFESGQYELIHKDF